MKYNSPHNRKFNLASALRFDSVGADGRFARRRSPHSVPLTKSLNAQQDFGKIRKRGNRKLIETGGSLPSMPDLIEGIEQGPKDVESNYQMYRNEFQK